MIFYPRKKIGNTSQMSSFKHLVLFSNIVMKHFASVPSSPQAAVILAQRYHFHYQLGHHTRNGRCSHHDLLVI